MPTVSVIIPTYNRADLLPVAVESALNQMYRDFEVIIADDGSEDHTTEVLKPYGDKIRYYWQPNRGAAAARNLGIRHATGQYVAFLDSDDRWLPGKLQRQVAFLDRKPDAGLVYAQAYWMNEQGLRLKREPHGAGQREAVVPFATLALGNAVCGGGSSAVVRRSCLDVVGVFDEQIRFVEDWDLWLRIAHRFPVCFIPEPLSYYRINTKGFRNWAPRPEQAERVHENNLRVLAKAFSLWETQDPLREQTRARAYSQEHLRHGLVLGSLGQRKQCAQHWLAALQHSTGYASDRSVLWQRITDTVAGQAILIVPEARIAAAAVALAQILDSVPPQIPDLRSDREKLLARILTELAFLAAQYQETSAARRCAFAAIRRNPTLLRNRGLIKILATGGRHLWPEPIGADVVRYSSRSQA